MDYGHEQTDKMLRNLEKKIQKEYSQAAREVEASMNKWLAQYQKNDAEMRELLNAGEISKKEYTNWRKKQILLSDKWKVQRDELTQRMMDADKVASGFITDHKMEVYALNYNYGTYEVEKGARIHTGFTLYNKDTVARLVKDDPTLLPPPGKTTSERIRKGELKKWNRKQVQSVMTQGILQGESIPKIAKRLAVAVSEKNAYSHYRAARTMTTSAENAGRMDSYKRAEGMGIEMGKTWLAAHDSRTRSSHREYDGMTIPLDGEFAKDLKFPGDPDAAPAEIYNCRCTLIANVMSINGIDVSHIGSRPWEENWNINYEEWKHAMDKQSSAPKVKSEAYQDFTKYLNLANVKYNRVEKHEKRLAEDEIIKRISGGDKTSGSCFSTACAYIGNKHGYDVLDFRGGAATKHFASGYVNIVKLQGINPTMVKGGLANAKKLLQSVEEGKEYLFTGGRHTAIVRRYEGRLQYLELQHQSENGWTDFERTIERPRVKALYLDQQGDIHVSVSDTLKNRFKAKGKMCEKNYLVDIGQFEGNDEFIDLLGYMNTSHDKQMKGTGGGIK